MTAVELASGYTAFDSPPAPTYRFVISSKAEKISIWLENLQSKKQWRTSYLDAKDYVTGMNSIPGASMVDYVSLFKDTLVYLMGEANQRKAVADADKAKIRRNLIEHVLKPVSLDRIDIVEAKLRDAEERLARTESKLCCVQEQAAATEIKLQEAEDKLAKTPKEVVHLYVASSNVKMLNDKGLIIWNDNKLEHFEFTNEREGIRILVPGWYILNLKVHLRPQSDGGIVDLRKNSGRIQCSQVPCGGGE
ncbi:hypothetical protein PHYSODRAFT_252108 [Phytophthora sojae]|uniref:Uncharacterized protein n=1 Tax=Phytophthora sojae (strain P6497) TaxID=1094619 RepID=G4YXL8_PHYSP|nr:hypothetical protein PHYSODRAFT_252108 [Phytophthora sojae]EGZ24507.1 hypothetical protein PHYSODRAFT_252108 [Phytophthora sojae]|eukprot:XP_009519795.1 hypothetical protein PHYSODRAFT_252108 [Phytophthora sojae]